MSLIPKKGTVYVVDDDEAVRDSLQWLLEGKDYRVRCFDSAESFLARFDPRAVACLIADIRLGGMTGPDRGRPEGRPGGPGAAGRRGGARAGAGGGIQPRPGRRAHGGEHHEEGRD